MTLYGLSLRPQFNDCRSRVKSSYFILYEGKRLEDKISIIKLIGLPESFAVVLLTFSFILLLAPYFSGADFGLFKVPQFTDGGRKKLKIIGPIIFLVLVMLFPSLITNRAPVASNNTNRNIANDNRNDAGNGITKNDNKPAPQIDAHNQAQQHIARAQDLYKEALFQDAIKECDAALGLEPANQEALDLKKDINEYLEIRNRNK